MLYFKQLSGRSSVVEHLVANENVVSSNLIARSIRLSPYRIFYVINPNSRGTLFHYFDVCERYFLFLQSYCKYSDGQSNILDVDQDMVWE